MQNGNPKYVKNVIFQFDKFFTSFFFYENLITQSLFKRISFQNMLLNRFIKIGKYKNNFIEFLNKLFRVSLN